MSRSQDRTDRSIATALSDRPFDAWRVPVTAKAAKLVAEVRRRVENYERHFAVRKRKRKVRDQATFETMVAAVVSDAVVHALSGHAGRIAIPRRREQLGRSSRYKAPALNEQLPRLLDTMASPELGILDMVLGWHDLDPRPDRERYRQTTIVAGPVLRSWITRDQISVDDFGRDEAEEIILLKGRKPLRGQEAPPHIEPQAPVVEYDDSSPDHPSHRIRVDMRLINAWIASASLSFAEGCPEELHRRYDLSRRRLRRHFTQNDFESGGRLFGGFWQTMERKHRRWLRINGEPTVTLDYQAMFVNLAYARMRAQPKGDPYMIRGWEAYRRGIQKLMQASFFRYSPAGRVPRDTRKHLPPGETRESLMHRIMKRHWPIRFQIAFEVGHYLMFEESEIIVAALLRLRGQGVHALPLHDALCVPRSAKDLTERAMEETYRLMTGGTIKVCVDAGDDADDDVATILSSPSPSLC